MSDLIWRVLNDPPLPGYRNMARDHALTETLKGGEGVLRLYRWDPPTISFGRNEPSRGLFLEEKAREEGVEFVRRPTGGRADWGLRWSWPAPTAQVSRRTRVPASASRRREK